MSLQCELPTPRSSPSVVLSISPRFAEQIYSGAKRIELRKSLPGAHVRWWFLLETDEVQAVTGFFRSDGTFEGPLKRIVPLAEGRGVGAGAVARYFRGLATGRAILVSVAHRFRHPITLGQLRGADPTFVPPHTFAYLGRLSAGARELFFRCLLDLGHAGVDHAVRVQGAGPRAAKAYAKMALRALRTDYEEIDSDFAAQIAAPERSSEALFFTHCKIPVRAFLAEKPLGYTTVTIKRGGAVKTGPTILLLRHQKKSRGPMLQRALADLVAAAGFHKVYCTCPSTRPDVIRYLFKSGFQVEAQLQRHYASDHDELVMGKLIWRAEGPNSFDLSGLPARRIQVNPHATTWQGLLRKVLPRVYCKIPEPLIHHIIATRPPAKGFRYSERPKSAVVAFCRDEAVAALVLSPKRGGSMRCTPLLLTSDLQTLKRLLERAGRVCWKGARRKLTVLSPLQWRHFTRALVDLDFELEGVLRCPYRASGDCAVYSKFFLGEAAGPRARSHNRALI